MASLPPWPVVGTLGAGLANLLLLRYVWRWRDEPGGRWFAVVIGVQVVWCGTYGAALLVSDPLSRYALEVLSWLPVNWIGVCFLAFALEYTGRVDLRDSAWFRVTVAFEVVSSALVLTNYWHGLVWSGFEVATAYGAATAAYAHHEWVYLQLFATFAQATLGIYVLLDTVASYGPLFRRQTVALALTPFPPGLAFAAWAFQVVPYPLNLTPMMFLPHAALDVYALFRNDMFEFPPTVRRTGERAAVDDLGTAVVVVDVGGRVVTLNDAAASLFETEKRAAQGAPLDDRYREGHVELEPGEQSLRLRVGEERRAFTVQVSALEDAAGTHVGYTVVFEDVTVERRRQQRLAVLNRILRHNLRNDLTVVRSYAERLAERVDDEAATEAAAVIDDQSAALLELGDKARRAAEALGDEREPRELAVADLVADVVDDLRAEHPDVEVVVDVPGDLRLATDPRRLELVVRSLLENAMAYGDGHVAVGYAGTDDDGRSAVLTVADDGPGLPDHEREVVEAGEESALAHGSGLGLWLARWGASGLGGDVAFDVDQGGTTVRLRVPGLVDGAGAASDGGDEGATRDGSG